MTLNELQEKILEAVRSADGTLDGPEWCRENDVELKQFITEVKKMEMYEAGVEFGVSPHFPWYREGPYK